MARRPRKSDGEDDPRRALPSVSVLLDNPNIQDLASRHTRSLVLEAVHETLERLRQTVERGAACPDEDETARAVEAALAESQLDRLRPVVNATGIILHTGLGRAVLPKRAAEALGQLDRCCNLQVDLETGRRGKRNYMTEHLLCKLTGAEAALVVNNNAGATLLLLAATCAGREAIISRGQLIEIGGSYRLPDCIRQSGATMVEVGTTNKTHLRDYEEALSENTGAILRVNPSNYRVVGFSKSVSVAELATLKSKQPFVLVDDLGCGALIDLSQYGLPKEPMVSESIAAGADLACFSGDKLIGGPQAGIVVGKSALIAKIKKHPLTRMLRVGKLTDIALEHTLRLFLEPETLAETNPTIRMLAAPAAKLEPKAQDLRSRLAEAAPEFTVEVREGASATGGGALPATPIPTFLLAVSSPSVAPEELCRRLRRHEPPVVARVGGDAVLLDMRTLLGGEDEVVLGALAAAVSRA